MTALTPELIATLQQLSADDKDRVVELLMSDELPSETLSTELERRMKQYERGEGRTYTIEEVMADLRKQAADRKP